MPILQPLPVPWKISPSVPDLGIRSKSLGGVSHGCVTFLGFFGIGTSLCSRRGSYGQIAVTLEWVVAIRMYPEFSKEDKKRINSYDWGAIPEFRDPNGGFTNYVDRFHDQWNSTNTCPNPSAYLLDESEWASQLGYTKDGPPQLQFNHYIFIGDDYNIEVIAKSFEWEIVEDYEMASDE